MMVDGKRFLYCQYMLALRCLYALRLSLPPAELSRRGHVARARRVQEMDGELHERSPVFGDDDGGDAELSRKRIPRRVHGRAEGRRGFEVDST